MEQNINVGALFCDETLDYRNPTEPDIGDTVKLRFRTAKGNVDRVHYIEHESGNELELSWEDSDGLFDYYQIQITVGERPVGYCFRVSAGKVMVFYNRMGVVPQETDGVPFTIVPGFHVPEWAKGAVMYQIYVDRFCNGDPSNDIVNDEYYYIDRPVHKAEDWKKCPATLDVGEFYGGDLQGVMKHLDYLQGLKVEVLYLNPIFVSPSNHKYDCQDYDHIDPHYGVMVKDGGETVDPAAKSNHQASKYAIRSASPENLEASDRFFATFMEEVHRRGMKVILDGVFNHCGSFNKWLDREEVYRQAGGYEAGAYLSEDSPYRTFFKFNDELAWPHNDSYDGWWGHSTLPKLNYEESEKLYRYIMGVARKWVSPPYQVDGWRLDVAADLGFGSEFNHRFWRDFRKNVRQANPDALILAEHYGDPSPWLKGDQWDSVMNYDAFMEPVSWFLTGMEKHSDERNDGLYGDGQAFFASMKFHMCRMSTSSLMCAMNELSNHDHSRFLTRTNRKVGRLATVGAAAASEGVSYGIFRAAVMIQMTWPGAPTIYYGDETGVCGWTDPDSRRTYPWGEEDQELIEYFRYMTGLHKRNEAIRSGSLKELAADRHLIAYGRFNRENQCVVVINNSTGSRLVQIPVWEIGLSDGMTITRKMMTGESGYNVGSVDFEVKDGMLEVDMMARSAVFFSADQKHPI